MKKKLVLACIAGLMAFGLCSCKNAGSGETPDYVGYQDLEIEKYVTLADYKNMKVSVAKPAADDAAIEDYINQNLLVGNITNRAVREGDTADIDFVGKKDGVAFEGGTGKGYKLGIGTGSFIPGFEEGLIGVMPGETVDLDLTFPDDYAGNAELAGQAVVFTVTVNSIEGSAEYAAVTEKEMGEMGLPYRTKEEVWEAGKRDVEENAKEAFAKNSKSAAINKLVAESKVETVPDYLVDEAVRNYNNYMASMAQSLYNMSLEDYVANLGETMEQYDSQTWEMCGENVKYNMVFEAFARAEGIEASEEEVRKTAAEEAAEYGYESGDALIEEAGFSAYRMYILQEKVAERLMAIVTVEEENVQKTE